MTRKLTTIFGLNEDGVSRRALSDIIQAAVDGTPLSSQQASWAPQLKKAVDGSGVGPVELPMLSIKPSPGGSAAKKSDGKPSAPRGIDVDPASAQDPGMAKSQNTWDKFAKFPGAGKADNIGPVGQNDVELGGAGKASEPSAEPATKKPGMLSRIFKSRGKKGLDGKPAPTPAPNSGVPDDGDIELGRAGYTPNVMGTDPSYGADFPKWDKPQSAAGTKVPKDKPARKPSSKLAKSTWDDLTHSGPKAPEPRRKSK